MALKKLENLHTKMARILNPRKNLKFIHQYWVRSVLDSHMATQLHLLNKTHLVWTFGDTWYKDSTYQCIPPPTAFHALFPAFIYLVRSTISVCVDLTVWMPIYKDYELILTKCLIGYQWSLFLKCKLIYNEKKL